MKKSVAAGGPRTRGNGVHPPQLGYGGRAVGIGRFVSDVARRVEAERRRVPSSTEELVQSTAYRYLVNLPGVCGSRAIVANTRIGVHDVMGLILNGASPEDVLRSFPDLTKAQIYECLAYYEDHRTEIDALVAEQMSETL